jgi:energy-coupling factor transport system ATP-binding protein
MEDIAKYVDRIVVMNKGRKIFDDLPKNVFVHYQELEQMGLAAPQVTYIMHALAERQIPVDTNATTIQEAVDTIAKALEK